MGPSGSGKTSLLNALSDHVAVTKGMHLSGSVTVNGRSLADSGVRTGYVEQEDMFYSQMSVRCGPLLPGTPAPAGCAHAGVHTSVSFAL